MKDASHSRLRPAMWGLIVLGYLLVFAAQSWLTREVFVQANPGANDFYPRWLGGCALLWEGASPYSAETTLRIQQGIYGRAADADEDQAAYAYPLHTLLLTWPTCLTRDFSVVQAVWMTFLTHAAIAGTILARRAVGWKAGSLEWAGTLVWAVIVYPNARAILLGQLSLIVFICLVGSLALVKLDHLAWAGLLLAAATIKPQMSLLMVAWLLWWAAHTGRRRLLGFFAGALGAMMVAVTLLDPGWFGGFVGQLLRYPSYTELGSGIGILTTYYLGTPLYVEALITVVAAVALLAVWWKERNASYGLMLWVTAVTALGTHFLAPRTATTHFAVLLVPLFMLFESWHREHLGSVRVWLTLGLVFVGSWALFLWTVNGNQENPINYIPIPVLMLVLLLWRRTDLAQAAAIP